MRLRPAGGRSQVDPGAAVPRTTALRRPARMRRAGTAAIPPGDRVAVGAHAPGLPRR